MKISASLFAAVLAGHAVAAAYQPSTDDLRAEVDKLYARLSWEERVAEIGGITVGRIVGSDGRFSREKAQRCMKHGIGHICQFAFRGPDQPTQLRDFVKDVQKFLIEESSSGIPAVMHEEVITGLAARGATTYPQQIGVAATWDPALVRRKCDETAQAGRLVGATFALSPMADVIYNATWTRLEEGYGESGYLAAVMGTAFVEGLERNPGRNGILRGMGACTKHFLGYGEIGAGSQRDWKDVYEEVILPHEAMIRRGDATGVMTSYDAFKGVQAVSNPLLIQGLLRDYIGFKGVVVSDYGAVVWNVPKENPKMTDAERAERAELLKTRVRDALRAGNDIDFPHAAAYREIVGMIAAGEIDTALVERAVKNALMLKARLGLLRLRRGGRIKSVADLPLDHDLWTEGPLDLDRPHWRATARTLAEESVVLLKNDGVLPLRPGRVALVGPNADSPWAMLGDYTYQSMQAFWRRNPRDWETPHVVTLREALKPAVYARGVDWAEAGETGVAGGGDPRTEGLRLKMASSADETDFDKAVAVAGTSDVIVAAMGENFTLCGESRQRADDALPKRQNAFVKALLATGRPVVLVLFSGRPIALEDDVVNRCAAIVEAWYPGEEGGHAVADVLNGRVNPSGRLPMTWPRTTDRADLTFGDGSDTPDRARWPFGHGLSYTTFAFAPKTAAVTLDVARDAFASFDFELTNTGAVDGTEVVQAYLALGRRRLRAFGRVAVEAGGRRTVRVRIPTESFAEWQGSEKGEWRVGSSDGTDRTVEVLVGPDAWTAPVRVAATLRGTRVFPVRDTFFGTVTTVAGETGDRATDAGAAARRRIVVPAGVTVSDPIRLASNTELYLEEGAELVIRDDPARYPIVPTSREGTYVMGLQPCIYAKDATNVAIRGKGTIRPWLGEWLRRGAARRGNPRHGEAKRIQVEVWNAGGVPLAERNWAALDGAFDRPQLIQFYGCRDVVLEDFTIRGSPFWTIHLLECANATVRGLDVFAEGHNTDGLDIESSRDVLVENCRFDQGDDGIVLKSGLNRDGRDRGMPTENVVIRNCVLTRGHGLLSIGSELSGGIRNVLLEDCRCDATVDKLFFIKSNPARGGGVENVTFRRVTAGAVKYDAFAAIANYFWKPEEHVGEEVFATRVKDILVEDVSAASCQHAYSLTGYAGNPIENVAIRNLTVAAPRKPSSAVETVNLQIEP